MEISDYELLLDSLQMAGVYVIRKDNHQLLYFNKWMKKAVPDIRLGTVRHELWVNPVSGGRREIENENIDDAHPLKGTARIEAARVLWEKKIPVSVVTVTPHNVSTINQKEQEYISKSLGNLFFAIYDINLQEDILHMVSQREEVKDILKMEMSFTEAIDIYSKNFVHSDFREEYVRKMSRSNLMEKLNENCPFAAIEYRRVKKNSGKIPEGDGWVRATVIATEFQDGKPWKLLYVAQDITEVKKKEEMEHQMLKEACEAANRANASKSEFLSRMSHDIRTPMNAIIGMTTIAEGHLDDEERVEDCLNKITVSSKHLLSLINEVLDMSKIESGKIDLAEEEFNISDLIQNLLTMIRPNTQAKNHKLELKTAKVEHEDVIGDVMRLQQVFMNILGNAVKYTPQGGTLELEIKERLNRIWML